MNVKKELNKGNFLLKEIISGTRIYFRNKYIGTCGWTAEEIIGAIDDLGEDGAEYELIDACGDWKYAGRYP
jgi:hypothetical protein